MKKVVKICGVALLCALVFAYGVAVGEFEIFPYRFLKSVAAAADEVVRYPKHTFRIMPEKFLVDPSDQRDRSVSRDTSSASPGVTFVVGFFDGRHGMRLLDLDGRVIHDWPVSFNDIWPDAKHLERQPHDWDTELHGAKVFPNGDVIFNFQYEGLVRIDRCSKVQWKLSRQTHHSVFQDSDGNLWVPDRVMHRKPVARLPGIRPPFQEELLLKVSPAGEVLEEISLLDSIYQSNMEGLILANGAHGSEVAPPLDGDFTHVNEIEALSPSLAGAFPEFAAGDLLVSVRNLNLLLVIDSQTKLVKWSTVGLFLRQHDPDFQSSGKISVFDNRRDNSGGKTFDGSLIREIDPGTRASRTVYGALPGEFFYTATMGEHQLLANGNLVITESNAGLAFEVAPDGGIVWSHVNRWSDGSVGLISQATRLPEDYFVMSELKEECLD